MRPHPLLLAFVLATSACRADPSPYGDPATTWVTDDFGRATLSFVEPSQISGQAACNTYGAAQTGDWPKFHAEAIFATKMACPDLALEADFFAVLGAATGAVLAEELLMLTNDAGVLITFHRE